jgi:hypothetical protein
LAGNGPAQPERGGKWWYRYGTLLPDFETNMPTFDPRIDEYIANSAGFAHPIHIDNKGSHAI